MRRISAPFVIYVGTAILSLWTSACLQQHTRLQSDDDKAREEELTVKTIGDVTTVANAQPIAVSGVGLVVGLAGTGSNPTPDGYRDMLEDFMRKRGVKGVKQILASPDTSLVLVSALIPAGAFKNDPIDLTITLPPHSKTTSLKGGYLKECELFNYDTTRHLNPRSNGPNRLKKGRVLAKGWGPVMVGFGSPKKADLRVGQVWGGGRCLLTRPFYLLLNSDQKRASLAIRIARRINETIKGPLGGAEKELAEPKNDQLVVLTVPPQYRLNMPRYLRVVRLIPLKEPGASYRRRLAEDLLDPSLTVTAALRLEALGPKSIDALKRGLESEHPLVRFCSAEALAYLGSPASGKELARFVEEQPALRAFSLTALASLNEAVSHVKLHELLSSKSAETRYGAFRALRAIDETHPVLAGQELAGSFWLHRAAPESPPLVHVSLTRRAEIVLFGEDVYLKPPFYFLAGEYVITATDGDDKCTISRVSTHRGVSRKQCSLKLEDAIRTIADLGGMYPEIVEFLQQANTCHCLSASVVFDALPQATSVYQLATKGDDLIIEEGDGDAENRIEFGATPNLFRKERQRTFSVQADTKLSDE